MFGLLPNRRGGWAKARSFVISQGPLPEGNGNERKVRPVQRANELLIIKERQKQASQTARER